MTNRGHTKMKMKTSRNLRSLGVFISLHFAVASGFSWADTLDELLDPSKSREQVADETADKA